MNLIMTEDYSQRLTQSQNQVSDDSWYDSQSSDYIEQKPTWGRIVRMRSANRRLGLNGARFEKSLGTTFDICDESFSIGRNPRSDWIITFDDVPQSVLDRISKNHCRITKDCSDFGNPVFIEDLSRNGTFINGQMIGNNEKHILKTDDIIAFNEPKNKLFLFINTYQETGGFPDDIFERYHIGRPLGSGAQGIVRLVIDRRTCEKFAMKVVQKNTQLDIGSTNMCNDPIMREVTIMKQILHPNIIHCSNVIVKQNSIYMFLEYMEGGDLLHRIQRGQLSVPQSRFFFQQLCAAVKYLHNQNITHRDIKPDNILLESHAEFARLKLSDFGLSKLLHENSQMETKCGTPRYVSPEIENPGCRGAYTNKVDIWSLGVVLYAMFCGALPFNDNPPCNKYKLDFSHTRFHSVPDCAKQLITMMLTINPECRPSIDDVLMHPWMQTEDVITQPPHKKRRIE